MILVSRVWSFTIIRGMTTEEYIIARNVLESMLLRFLYESYSGGIERIREEMQNQYYVDHWGKVKDLIFNRKLNEGEPIYFVKDVANNSLYENTDDEAYRFLELMIKNIERTDGIIEDY